jgi:excisionase family DNA binding protein
MSAKVRRKSAPTFAVDLARPALTVEEAAAALGINRATLYRIMGRGELRWTTVGKRRRIPQAELDAYLNRQAS